MGLKPGMTNNKSGRPRGSQNRATKSLRGFMHTFLDCNKSQLQSDFDALSPKDRLILFEKFLSFALPKMNNIGIENLSEENLDTIISEIKKTK